MQICLCYIHFTRMIVYLITASTPVMYLYDELFNVPPTGILIIIYSSALECSYLYIVHTAAYHACKSLSL
jgi:hypothetical protein